MTTENISAEISNKFFSDTDELTILANWSMGKHREDISEIESFLFIRKKLYKAVAEGLNPTEIMRAGALEDSSVSELMGIASSSFYEPYYRDGVETPVYEEAKTRALIKQISTYTDKIRNCNGENTEQLIEKIKRTESALNGEEFKPLHTHYGSRFIEELEQIKEESNPRYGAGFKFLDRYTEGLHRGELTVIGARPKVGKSAIALQIAYNVAIAQGFKVLYITLEMKANACLNRILLHTGYCEPGYEKNCTEEDKEQISNYLDSLEDNLKFCESLNKLEDIEKIIKAEKPYLVVIDQLSLLVEKIKGKDIRERYVFATRALKRIALEQNTAIILLSQINRANNDNSRPGLETFAESDSIGQDADNALTLYTKNNEEETDCEKRVTYLLITKQRNGRSGVEIPLMYTGAKFKFDPIDLNAENY